MRKWAEDILSPNETTEASKAMEQESVVFRNQYNVAESTLSALLPNTFPLSSKKAESEFSIVILGSFSQTLLQTFCLNFVMFS